MKITKITVGEGEYLGVSFSFTLQNNKFDIIDLDEDKLNNLINKELISEEDYDNFDQILIEELHNFFYHNESTKTSNRNSN